MSWGRGFGRVATAPFVPFGLLEGSERPGVSGPPWPGRRFENRFPGHFYHGCLLSGVSAPSCPQYVQQSSSAVSPACQWLRESQALRGDSTGLAKSLAASVCHESVSCSSGCDF